MTINAQIVSATSKSGRPYKYLELELIENVKTRVFLKDSEIALLELAYNN